jgi:glycine dehydrogenase subunit 2
MASAGKIRLADEVIDGNPERSSKDKRSVVKQAVAQFQSNDSVPLIFELSSPGSRDSELASRRGVVQRATSAVGADLCREDLEGFPELSEPQVMRHFLRLSQQNFAAALQFYPLGSCTMKYNPVINDELAGLPGFAQLHPRTPDHLAQGALRLMWELESALAEISGMHAISLHPAAGAQGEFAGLLIARAFHRKNGENRRKILIPDTAHGTNPASSALAGFEVATIRSSKRGYIEASEIEHAISEDVAALMVTNPNTLGIFEPEIQKIAAILHAKGALLYFDGANFNALMGIAKPGHMGADIVQINLHKTFSTPHGGGGPGAGPIGVQRQLERFLPSPRIAKHGDRFGFDRDLPDSIGRLRSFYGNFGMLIRAYAYILALGGDGLADASRLAVLNANYLRKRLADHFPAASSEPMMHECVLTHDLEKRAGVSTLEIAKRLLDFGIHPPTIYFPLVVPGALMIEPTETESKETIDAFVETMKRIYEEALSNPQLVKSAPNNLRLSRVDEAEAARRPVLRWTPALK